MAGPVATLDARVFVVGCPRSGTTLVQSLLNAHPAVRSFPETHAFMESLADPPWDRLGLASRGSTDRIRSFLEDVDRSVLADEVPRVAVTWGRLARALVQVLDAMAAEDGASAWVEKTPDHLEHVDRLETHVPRARFVHVLRNGPDVVASLRDVTRDHPEAWGRGRPWSLEECAEKWAEAVRTSLHHADDEAHLNLRYEDVADDPEATLTSILDHVGLPDRDQVLAGRSAAADEVVRGDEPWKADVAEDVENRNGERFHQALGPEERERVMDLLDGTGLDRFVERPPAP